MDVPGLGQLEVCGACKPEVERVIAQVNEHIAFVRAFGGHTQAKADMTLCRKCHPLFAAAIAAQAEAI